MAAAAAAAPLPRRSALLVVAHPDDESMFFAPALMALAAARAAVHVLCLSTGNAAGLGPARAREMLRACKALHVPEENVCVLDHPELQDGFQEAWSVALIRDLVEEALSSKDINVVLILTFDRYGVSGHPNHRAVHGGVRSLVLQQRGTTNVVSDTSSLEAWELTSTNVFRKFCGPFDIAFSLLEYYLSKQGTAQCYVSLSVYTSIVAMRQHATQWVWFRWLFVLFARYTYVNTLKRI
eukprot:SM000002S05488  [mRNA]  locus=s2:53542:55597:+ [translate_table: standard]